MTDYERLRDIANEPDSGGPADQAEMLVGTGGKIEIAGHVFPAPAAAVIALLDAIESPFVTDITADVDLIAVLRTLYVIAQREDAALPILRIKRRQQALAKLKVPDDGAGLMIYAEQIKALADADAELDASAIRWGESLGAFDMQQVAAEIGSYLAMATGFSMLPSTGDESKKK